MDQEEIRKYFESNNNEYRTNEKLRVITKAMLRGNFTAFKNFKCLNFKCLKRKKAKNQ